MKKKVKNDYNHHHSPELKEHALRTSIKEGSAAAASSSIGENYITPYALALGAQPIHIGILSSLSGFAFQIAQYFGSILMERYPRKRITMIAVLIQSFIWLLIASFAYLFIRGILKDYLVYALITFYTLMMISGGIGYPSWFSWMGDIVPEKGRGEYFSRRSRIASTVGLIIILISSFLLDMFKTKGYLMLGLSLLFVLAFIFRLVSYIYLQKQFSPKFKFRKRDYFSFWDFLKRYDNFGKFAVYHGFFNFAIMVASPFFAVYMLRELNFNYTIFTIINISLTIFMILVLPLVGKISDRYGNKSLLVIANTLFILTPLLWLVSKNPIWLIFIPQLCAGVANAASIISYSNFTYDAVSPKHRALCITYSNILIGKGIFFGSLLGGLIVNYWHPSGLSPFIFVFLIASLLRFVVAIYFLPRINEVKRVRNFPSLYTISQYPLHRVHVEAERFVHFNKRLLGKFKNYKVL